MWIVAKPFRFRDKAVRRRFHSVFGQLPYWNSLSLMFSLTLQNKLTLLANSLRLSTLNASSYRVFLLLHYNIHSKFLSNKLYAKPWMETSTFHMRMCVLKCSIDNHDTIHTVYYIYTSRWSEGFHFNAFH